MLKKKDGLDLKGSSGRPKKVTQRVEKIIILIVYDSLKYSTRGLAFQVERDFGLGVSHKTIRNFLEEQKYSSRVVRKNDRQH